MEINGEKGKGKQREEYEERMKRRKEGKGLRVGH